MGSLVRRTPPRWPSHGEPPDGASAGRSLRGAIDTERTVVKGRQHHRHLRRLLPHGRGGINGPPHRRGGLRTEPFALLRPPGQRSPPSGPCLSLHPQRREPLPDPTRRLPPSAPLPQRRHDRRHHVQVPPGHGLGAHGDRLAAGLALIAPHGDVMDLGLRLCRQRSPYLPRADSMSMQTQACTDRMTRCTALGTPSRSRLLHRGHLLQPPLDTPASKRHNLSRSWVLGHLSSGAERDAERPNSGRPSHLVWGAICRSCLSSLPSTTLPPPSTSWIPTASPDDGRPPAFHQIAGLDKAALPPHCWGAVTGATP